MKHGIDYPPVWLAGFAALAFITGQVVPMTFPGIRVAGWAVTGAWLALMAVAAAQMLARRTSLDPHGAPSSLVTGGVFRLSRNPIYVADTLLLGGLALLWQAPLALLLVPVFGAIISRRFIRPEEARLAARFPGAWPAFAARTRRWL